MDRSSSIESLEIKIKTSTEKVNEDENKNSTNNKLLNTNGESISNNNSRKSLYQGSVSYERLRSLKQMVDRAIKEHRIFSVAGPFPTIRQALKQRGWLEKMGTSALHYQQPARRKRNSSKAGEDENCDENPDPLLVARLLRNCTPDLLWALRSETVDWRGLARWQLVNRFPKALFTTKIGLSCALQHMQWFTEEGVSDTLFPRCYCVNQQDELVGFIHDFRLTACYSMLRQVTTSNDCPSVSADEEKPEENKTGSPRNNPQVTPTIQLAIPPKAVVFALTRAGEHVRHLRHEDVDDWSSAGGPSLGPGAAYGHGPGGPGEGGRVWDCEWDQFLTYYYQLVHEGAFVRWENSEQKEDVTRRAGEAIMQYSQLRPHQNHDGFLNLWIVKPGARSCGRGIQVMNRLESIIARTQPGLGKEARFVVQKYIERPLLIYNTKFDIRQWFLVTCAQPLTIWMYRESYLRFCSQIFDMTNLHESVHLSNNAVQCRYQNCRRDSALPDENMWDCYTFQTYLRSIGRAEAWDEIIYPGMRTGIIGAMLASQDWLDSQRNCFELYGADFLLSEGDMKPWLLEVNCSPCMAPSTSVTARMCAQCLEDVLRVDRRDDREASTGMFDLVYRQNSPPAPPYQGVALGVRGRRLTASRPKKRHRHRKVKLRGRVTGSRACSSTCSSSCSSCSSDDDARVDLAAQTRVTLASPLKVIKAEINVPVKHRKSPSVNQILSSQMEPSPISATELRTRLEKLVAENALSTKYCNTAGSHSASARPGSRTRSMQTAPTSPPAAQSTVAKEVNIKQKKHKKTSNTGKFKGKISGKNITVLQRENDLRFGNKENTKVGKKSKADKNINKKHDKKNPKNKSKVEEIADANVEVVETITSCEAENDQNQNKIEVKNTKLEENTLMLQTDNLRQTTRELIDADVDVQSEDCFKDPGRSLALVKEWRRRLEATRASCEQMLAQLKAFRDPPSVKSSTTLMLGPSSVDFAPPTCHADTCIALGSKLRKLSSKNHKIIATSIESTA